MTTHVFVYGSLKRGFWNNRILGDSRLLGTGITISDSYSMFDGAFPYVITGGISKIAGEVYEVTDERILLALDRLEGVPSHYVRSIVEVKLYRDDDVRMPGTEDVVECIMYVASKGTAAHVSTRYDKYRIVPDHQNVLAWKESA